LQRESDPVTKDQNAKRSRAKGSTSAEQFATAEALIRKARSKGAKTLELRDFRLLTALPSEIAGLTALRNLRLSRSRVRDLTPISHLVNLETLWLTHTTIVDLTPISGLRNLRRLFLGFSQASDLQPIASCNKLVELYLHFAPV
jgi:Leucine-rich repeat (LRR) protein